MKAHRFSLPFTSFGGEQCISPMKSFCLKQYSLRGTLTRVATVSVPIVAETCARRGAGFSRFLQLVPGEGESQTTGELCVLHFLYKGQLPSRRHSLGYCLSQASKYEWPPSSRVFSFCHLLRAWSRVLASRRHSTIRSSRRPLQP